MPYLVSSIIAIVSATIILLTRYEADDSTIMSELEKMKSMIITIDGFVSTYVESGGSLTSVNFEELYNSGVLLGNIKKSSPAQSDDNVKNVGILSELTFPSSNVIWQLIPNKNDSSSYKLFVDMRANSSLMAKAIFAESFSGREYCEKMLFGDLERKSDSFDTDDFKNSGSGSDNDGLFVCIVYK